MLTGKMERDANSEASPDPKKNEQRSARHRQFFRGTSIDRATLWFWTTLIAAALVAFWATRGTQFHPLALAILLSSLSLLIALSIFELVWAALKAVFDAESPGAVDRRETRE